MRRDADSWHLINHFFLGQSSKAMINRLVLTPYCLYTSYFEIKLTLNILTWLLWITVKYGARGAHNEKRHLGFIFHWCILVRTECFPRTIDWSMDSCFFKEFSTFGVSFFKNGFSLVSILRRQIFFKQFSFKSRALEFSNVMTLEKWSTSSLLQKYWLQRWIYHLITGSMMHDSLQ